MKLRLFGILLILVSFGAKAQVETLYTEKFDPPSGPDSVKTYNNVTANTAVWNDTNSLWVSPTMSYHARTVPFDILYFETDSFSTLGKRFVRMKFSQICKIYFLNKGFIQISVDSGNTWISLDSNQYQGSSPNFKALGYFYENSYPAPLGVPFWGGATLTPPGVSPDSTWWAHETFDISDIAGVIQTNGDTGFADVRLRFALTYGSGQTIASGWYVDDLLIEGSPCELEEPTLDWVLIPPAYPIGARYQATQKIKFEATDNAGLDSALLYYRVNGGLWKIEKMTAASTPSCTNSKTTIKFNYTITSIVLHDTIDWYVEVYDCSCPNITRDPVINAVPVNYYTFWRNPAPPAICGQALPGSFPQIIGSFPYLEDFENASYWVSGTGNGSIGTTHRGDFPVLNPPTGLNWTVAPSAVTTGYAWSVRNSSTATLQTGPNQDNTPNGTVFIYTEASQGQNLNKTQFITPCIDLQGAGCMGFEFYYHMYGSHINRLTVDIDTGNATSSFVNSVWKQVGAVQLNSNSAFERGYIPLEDYDGKIIRIRFRGVRGTGEKGDIAIDDLRIYAPKQIDAEMVTYYTPQNFYCSYSSNDSILVKVRSTGCITQTAMPIGYSVKNLSTLTTTTLYDTIKGNIVSGFETNHKFSVGANLSAYAKYEIFVFTDMPGDSATSNDTLGPFFIDHEKPYSTWPYVATHDASPWLPGDGTITNPGTFDDTLFTPVPSPTSGNYTWFVGSDLTPTTNTGPRRDRSYTGNYIYTEGDFGVTKAILLSKCMDLTGMTTPAIDFWHHSYGLAIDKFSIQIKKPGKNTWSVLAGSAINGQTQAAEKDPWKFVHVDLTPYAGKIIQLRLVGAKTSAGTMADMALDDLSIYDRGNTDVGVTLINKPSTRVNLSSPFKPKFIIRNFGKNAVSNIPIKYSITPLCGPNAGVPVNYTDTYSGSIASGVEVTFTASSVPTYPKGDFKICASTNKTGDNVSHNDESCTISAGWSEEFIQNGFFDNFDNCNTGTSLGGFPSGDLSIFEVGAPNNGGITSAASSPNVLMSGLDFNYFAGKSETYNMPRFIGFDTIAGAQLKFDHNYKLGPTDAITVEFFIAGNWNVLGFPGSSFCPTWFNASNIPSLGNGSGWVGSSAGWESTCWPLSIFNFSSAPFVSRFRLESTTGSAEGWAIDNLEVYIPPQNSAAPVRIRTLENIPVPDQDNHFRVYIKNTGAKMLDTVLVQYDVNGTGYTSPELVVFKPAIIPGRERVYNFLDIWNKPPSGSYQVCVVTSRPNNKQDNLTVDDTLCATIVIPDKIIMAQDSSYCNDFEDPTQTPWLKLNSFYTDGGLQTWEFGTPNQAPILSANSGVNAWMTDLDSNYRQRDSSALHTPFFVVDSGVTYKLSFSHYYLTELYHDGGNVEVSHDGGLTWYTVGNRLLNGKWYSHDHITALDVIRPGWSGSSNGWIQSEINITFDDERTSIFRFRFGADQSFEFPGWAIDDFCLAVTSDRSDWYIGIDDQTFGDIGIGNVIPNPTSGETYVPLVMSKSGTVNVSAYNMLGQQVMQKSQEYEVGENRVDFNVSLWETGVYFVVFEFEGTQYTRKLIVN